MVAKYAFRTPRPTGVFFLLGRSNNVLNNSLAAEYVLRVKKALKLSGYFQQNMYALFYLWDSCRSSQLKDLSPYCLMDREWTAEQTS